MSHKEEREECDTAIINLTNPMYATSPSPPPREDSQPPPDASFNLSDEDDSEDEDEEEVKVKIPWKQRIMGWPSATWNWIRANKVKTAILLLVLGVIVFIIMEIAKGALTSVMTTALVHVKKIGPWGPIAMIAIDILVVPLLVPSSVLNVGSGFLFGFGLGYAVQIVGINAGASLAFYLSKRFLYSRVQKKVEGFKTFKIINASLESSTNRWNALKMVLLARLPPLFPFPVCPVGYSQRALRLWQLFNYAFGLTKVSFPIYLIGSVVGLTPGLMMDVFLGSLFSDLTQVNGAHPTWYIGVAVGVTVVATLAIGFETKRTLKKVQKRLDEEKRAKRRARKLQRMGIASFEVEEPLDENEGDDDDKGSNSGGATSILTSKHGRYTKLTNDAPEL